MENRITISILATRLADGTGRSRKSCEEFIKEFFKLAADVLSEGENLRIKGFGSFKVTTVDARGSIDVTTGRPNQIDSHKKVVFTPSKEMAAIINAPFEIFESVELEDDDPLADLNVENTLIPKEEKEPADNILEAGSAEENYDDEITEEAYVGESDSKKNVESIDQSAASSVNNDDEIKEIPVDIEKKQPTENGFIKEPFNVRDQEVIYIENPIHFKRGIIVGSLATLVLCLIIFMLGCFLGWWPVNFESAKEKVMTEIVEQPEDVSTEQTDTIENIILQKETEPQTPQPTKTIYDTVTKTRYLTTIAREHYGNYHFWPYIYMENEKILGHPDRITPGTKVVVPPLSKYGVDATNKTDEKEAKKLGYKIYSKFK